MGWRIAVSNCCCVNNSAVLIFPCDCVGVCTFGELCCVGHISCNGCNFGWPTAENITVLCITLFCRCCTVIRGRCVFCYIFICFKNCVVPVFPCDSICRYLCTKVARVICTAVNVGIGLIYFISVICRSLTADNTCTIIEHIRRTGYIIRIPVTANINGCKVLTVVEHIAHTFNRWGIPTAKIKWCKVLTVGEHHIHSCNLGGIPTAHIKWCKALTLVEHLSHICNICGIPTAHIKSYKVLTVVEHTIHTCNRWGIPTVQIKWCKTPTPGEHIAHICNLRGIPTAHIKRCKWFTISKHTKHIGGITCIKIGHIYWGRVFQISEQPTCVYTCFSTLFGIHFSYMVSVSAGVPWDLTWVFACIGDSACNGELAVVYFPVASNLCFVAVCVNTCTCPLVISIIPVSFGKLCCVGHISCNSRNFGWPTAEYIFVLCIALFCRGCTVVFGCCTFLNIFVSFKYSTVVVLPCYGVGFY